MVDNMCSVPEADMDLCDLAGFIQWPWPLFKVAVDPGVRFEVKLFTFFLCAFLWTDWV